jgi:hypothetical protein
MKFVSSLLLAVTIFAVFPACSGPSRPKVKPAAGPPPEYEAPRSFDLPGSKKEEPAAPAEESPPPPPADKPPPS